MEKLTRSQTKKINEENEQKKKSKEWLQSKWIWDDQGYSIIDDKEMHTTIKQYFLKLIT